MDYKASSSMITKDLKLDVMRHKIEEKVFEVSRPTGMLASSNEG
jgi:hypothetical protein